MGEGRQIYSPVVDLAVGPFAIQRTYEAEYTQALMKTRGFVESLINKHNKNVVGDIQERVSFDGILHFNENARCLFCIEIEDTGSRKHLLGDLINASALGRIGVLVARSATLLDAFLRQRVYLRYLKRVGKNTFHPDNSLVILSEQFDECLSKI